MRCVICDAVLNEPDYNRDLQAYEPCGTCLAVISDAVGSFGDKPYAEEDQLVDDSPFKYPGMTSSEWAAIAAANPGIPYD